MVPRQPIYFVNCFLVVCAILGLAALAAGAIGWWAALDLRGGPGLLGGIVGAATAVYAMVYSAIAEYGRFRPWLVVSHTLVLALAQVASVVLFVFDRPEAMALDLTPLQSAIHDPQAPRVIYGASLAAAAAIAVATRGWRALRSAEPRPGATQRASSADGAADSAVGRTGAPTAGSTRGRPRWRRR